MSTTPTSIGILETEETERKRLAEYPEGSLEHHLSTLPVAIRQWPQDTLVTLPSRPDDARMIVVVPLRYLPGEDLGPDESFSHTLHPGAWECVVVHSENPDVPVGGEHITVDAVELSRGTEAIIEGTRPPF